MKTQQLSTLINMPPVPVLRHVFGRAKRELYLVGGTVRDVLLVRPVSDLDFATVASPTEAKRLLRRAGADSIYSVGEKFGTIGAIFEGQRVEITTYRSEAYQAGSRKPDVQFGISLIDDLSRRDFTINAMALDLNDGHLEDPFGGQGDLSAGLLRAVGEAEERFAEDPLRLLRAIRFGAQLSFRLEPSTRRAMARMAHTLGTISRERIAQEMNRILVSGNPSAAIRELCELGLMEHIIPEILAMRGMRNDSLQHKDVFEHTMVVLDRVPPLLHLRWAALLHDIAKPRTLSVERGQVHFYGHDRLGEQMTRRVLGPHGLKYDRETTERVARLVALHLRPNSYEDDWTDGAVRRFMREADELLDDLLALSRADVTSRSRERVLAAERRVERLQQHCAELQAEAEVARLASPLDGNELMELFNRPPGPWIGVVKNHLLEMVLDGTLAPDDKEAAAEEARRLAGTLDPVLS